MRGRWRPGGEDRVDNRGHGEDKAWGGEDVRGEGDGENSTGQDPEWKNPERETLIEKIREVPNECLYA